MARLRKSKPANRNTFDVLSADDGEPTEPETNSHQATPVPHDPTPMAVDDETELSALTPLTSTPITQSSNLTQSSLSSFVQSRPRDPDPVRPAANRVNTAPQQRRSSGRIQLPQQSQRLQHIDAALRTEADNEAEDEKKEKTRKKRRRLEEDEGGYEVEAPASASVIAAAHTWEPNQPSPLRHEYDGDEEEEEDPMYVTDDSGDDRPSVLRRRTSGHQQWTAKNEEPSPTKPPPRKRILHPAVARSQTEGKVNPFAKFGNTTYASRVAAPRESPYVAPPLKGFPPISTTPTEAFKYCTQASIERVEKIEGDMLAVFILGDPRVSAPIHLARRKVLLAMTIKAIIKDNTADPNITPMEVDPTKPDGGTYQHKMIQVWIVSNLSSTALTTLASQSYWSRQEITIGILGRPADIPIPPYCLTLWETTFLNADRASEAKMEVQVRSVLRSLKEFTIFAKVFNDKCPAYMGPEEHTQFTIDSARTRSLLIEHNSSPMVLFLVDIKSPTADAEEWEKVRQGLRHVDWTGVHCATVKARIHDYHCGFCKGLDHPTPQCPLPSLGFHPNTIDDQADGAQPSQQRRSMAIDDDKVNPFGGAPTQAMKGGNGTKQSSSKQHDGTRPPNSRNQVYADTPRLPPFQSYQNPPYNHQQYPNQPRQGDNDGNAGPSNPGQQHPPTNNGKGRGGRHDDSNQHQDWQGQWSTGSQHQQPTYSMPPPPPHYRNQYYGDQF